MEPSEVSWPEPWEWVGQPEQADYRRGWETQLATEVGPGHILSGQRPTLVARRFDTDDALFVLADGRWAEVHMTWRSSSEHNPRWPAASIFASFAAWLEHSRADRDD